MLIFSLIVLLFGVCLLYFGLRLLLKRGFVGSLREGVWKNNSEWFSKKESHFYDKYVRGIESMVVGLIAIIVAMFGLLKYFNVI